MTAQELFDQLIPRLNCATPITVTFLDAINQTAAIIANRLVNEWGSDLVREETVLEFSAGNGIGSLPDGYLGVADDPYIAGTTNTLVVAGAGASKNNQAPGSPSMYAILRNTIKLIPTPELNTRVVFEFFARPVPLTGMGDDLPFYGAMDFVIMDALLRIGAVGGFATAMPDYKYITDLVDDIARRRTPKKVSWKYSK